MKRTLVAVLCIVGPLLVDPPVEAQRGGGAPQPPRAPRAAAPIDLTGYWVSATTRAFR